MVKRVITNDVYYLLQDQTKVDYKCIRFIEDRTFKTVVASCDAEQIIKQPLLVRSLDGLYKCRQNFKTMIYRLMDFVFSEVVLKRYYNDKCHNGIA